MEANYHKGTVHRCGLSVGFPFNVCRTTSRSRPIYRNTSNWGNFHGNTEMFAPLASDGNRKSFWRSSFDFVDSSNRPRGGSQTRRKKDFRGRCWNTGRREQGSWKEITIKSKKREGFRILRRQNFSTFPRRMNDWTGGRDRECASTHNKGLWNR